MDVKCRACLSTTDTIKYYPLLTVFPGYFKTNLTILELLEVVTSTSVCDLPGAPNNICQACLKQLRDSYKFIGEFKKAQLWLKRKCNQPSTNVSGKVEKHENVLGKKIYIKFENDEKDPSIRDISQGLINSESTNQSGDAEISVNNIKHENFVYIDHDYPKNADISEETITKPETIIIKVDPINIELEKNNKKPARKIKPRAKQNDPQKLSSSKLNTRVSYKFKEPPSVVCEICQNKFYTERALCVHKEIVHPIIRIEKVEVKAQTDTITQKDTITKGQSLPESSKESKQLSVEKNNKQTPVSKECKSASDEHKELGSHRQATQEAKIIKKVPAKWRAVLPRAVRKEDKILVHGVGLTQKYLCTQCGKRFTHLNGFKYHLAAVHHGEKPYMCKFCGYKSFQENDMLNHKKAHIGEKPYECKLCNKKFKNASNLKEHQLTHKGTVECTCEYCGKGFVKNWNMKLHWLKHEGKYKCKMCSKGFVNEAVLKFHRSHSHKIAEKEIKDIENMDILSHSDSELLFVKELPEENFDLDSD